MTDILVPALGESVTEATVAKWLKKPGDAVRKDEPVVELETDKVTLEAPAPADGVLGEIRAAEGQTVGIGAVLGVLNAKGAVAPAPAPAKIQPAPAKAAPAPAAAAPAPAKPAAIFEVTIPAMGESVSEGTIGRWLVKEGSAVSAGQPLVEIETDKVAVEVPAPAAGVLQSIVVKAGETVTVGTVVALVAAGAGAAAAPAAAPAPAPAPVPAPQAAAAAGVAMPAARRVMAEGGIDPAQVDGTGRDGRITKADALKALSGSAPAPAAKPAPAPGAMLAPQAPRALGPREERVRMTRLRATIARRLKEAQNSAAMLTTFNDVDMTNVMAARTRFKDLFEKKHGVKLGFMSFFVKAVIQALKDVPAVNAEIDGDDIIYKNYYDIGVAVGTDKGLVVPVVRDADHVSLGAIELAIADLGRRARDGKLGLDDMQGATFTITNGGVYGSLMSTPILNAPQSGILGMHRIEERPVVVKGSIVARPMMYLALSYDHRIVDGKEAVTFLVRVKECIEDPDRLLLDL